jgi:bifunctional non-homologous end joining protein LigD
MRTIPTRRAALASSPAWIKPQLAKLVERAPDGSDWLHEIKFDGYRMHARLDAGRVQILTRRGNDWTDKYPAIAKAIAGLPAQNARLASLLNGTPDCLRYNDHQIGHGRALHRLACEHGVEGIVSKRANGRYEPDRRTSLKVKCLNREEFVVVGWSDPEGSRQRIGSLLLGYYTLEGRLIYAGRAGTGLPGAELEPLW